MNEQTEQINKRIITRWDLFKVFIASFFMQAVWNFRSLLSIGFSVCFFPILGKLCSGPEVKKNLLQRHLRFFNAHPYFASFALGVSIRLEELRAIGEPNIPETLDRLKNLLISPLGAVGDRLFWATIKPASLIVGMLFIFVASTVPLKLMALIITLFIYNIPHFYYRYKGIVEGYQHPLDIYKYVGQNRFKKLRKLYSYLFVISLIALVAIYGIHLFNIKPGLIAVFLLAALYSYIFSKISKNFYVVNIATLFFFIVVGILFI